MSEKNNSLTENTNKNLLNNSLLSKILFILIIILAFLFVLSFTKAGINGKDKRTPVKTALFNKKNSENLEHIEIKNGNDTILLHNTFDFWTVSKNNSLEIPADSSIIASFINDISSVRQIYQVSDKPAKENKFGFDSDQAYNFRIYLKDGTFSELQFGSKDFSLSSRFIMTGKKLTVYQISDFNEAYLSVNIQSWSDPYIVSKAILPDVKTDSITKMKIQCFESDNLSENTLISSDSGFTEKASKLLELRHGGQGNQTEIEGFDAVMKITLDFGNKDKVILTIFPSQSAEREYNVKTDYSVNLTGKDYTFSTKISLWTYNKIKEIML